MTDNKRNILQVTAKVPSWGFDLFRQIDIGFSEAGHKVTTVFLGKAKYVGHSFELGHRGNVVRLNIDHKQPFWRIAATYRLFRLMRALDIDTIFSHHYKPSSIMAFIERFLPVEQAFMVNHNPGNLRRSGRRKIIRYLFSRRWKFITVSEWVHRDFLAQVPWLPGDRVQPIYNCIDIDATVNSQLERIDARKKLGISQHAFVFGNIHRLDPSKGHDYMIEAFARACKDRPDTCLVIIGGGERKSMLEDLAGNAGVGDRVILTGLIPDASQYVRAFDVFVIPSLHEGFGLGLLEGMAAAIPVIASDGGALPEVVGNTGFLFKAGDKIELADRMIRLLDMSEDERAAAGQQCFERLNHFTPAKYHQRFLSLFNEKQPSDTYADKTL